MECTECGGEIDIREKKEFQPEIGCFSRSSSKAYPCKECGRFHWDNGKPLFNKADQRVFLENNRIVFKDKNQLIAC